jgi:hypothetical protein
MTWNVMSHEVKKLKGILTNDKKEIIGFILSGMTYDGDGNIQCEQGTDMQIAFKNKEEMKNILNRILKEGKNVS